jgi:hypothetical protein
MIKDTLRHNEECHTSREPLRYARLSSCRRRVVVPPPVLSDDALASCSHWVDGKPGVGTVGKRLIFDAFARFLLGFFLFHFLYACLSSYRTVLGIADQLLEIPKI